MDRLGLIKASQLKQLAVLCGTAQTGTKGVISAGLMESVMNTRQVATTSRLVSVDMGLRNIAVCELLLRHEDVPQIGRWTVVDLEGWRQPRAFEQPNFAQLANRFVANGICGSSHRSPDIVLIERQRLRSGGSSSVPEVIAQINVLEGMIHALLLAQGCSHVESVSPKSVTSYWIRDTGASKLSASQRYNQTKKAKVKAVEQLLAHPNGLFRASSDVMEQYDYTADKLKKRDDLCDSFLQALCWVHWQENRSMLKQALSSEKNDILLRLHEMEAKLQNDGRGEVNYEGPSDAKPYEGIRDGQTKARTTKARTTKARTAKARTTKGTYD
jgi:hypothetical protein